MVPARWQGQHTGKEAQKVRMVSTSLLSLRDKKQKFKTSKNNFSIMKITKLLNQYKAIARSMKAEAKNYSRLSRAVRLPGCTKETYKAYRESWIKLLEMSNEAYGIMFDYRRLSESLGYKILFTLGIMPRQNGFRYIDDKKCQFNATQLINVVNY